MRWTLVGILAAAPVVVLALAAGAARADGPRARAGVHLAAPGVAVQYRSHSHRPPSWHYAPPHARYRGPRLYLAPMPLWAPPIYHGIPWYGGAYWYGPGYTTVVPVPTQPPVYIERGPDEGAPVPQAAAPGQGWWYWCSDPQGYYPEVRECPDGWQPVAPQPSPSRP